MAWVSEVADQGRITEMSLTLHHTITLNQLYNV